MSELGRWASSPGPSLGVQPGRPSRVAQPSELGINTTSRRGDLQSKRSDGCATAPNNLTRADRGETPRIVERLARVGPAFWALYSRPLLSIIVETHPIKTIVCLTRPNRLGHRLGALRSHGTCLFGPVRLFSWLSKVVGWGRRNGMVLFIRAVLALLGCDPE